MDDLQKQMLEYRAMNNISQKEFARRCGVTLQTIYSIENNLQEPSKLTRTKIELVLSGKKEA